MNILNRRKKELQRKDTIIEYLQQENAKLRVEVATNREETIQALEAKEAERLELCDQLGHEQERNKVLVAKNERLANGLKTSNRENRFLIRTNAELAAKLNVKPVKPIFKDRK